MGSNDEAKPLTGFGSFGYGPLALLVALAGGAYILSVVPIQMAVITQQKVETTSDSLTKESVSKAQSFYWIGYAIGAAIVLPSIDRFGRKYPYFGLLAVGLVFTLISTRAHTAFLYGFCIFFIGLTLPTAGMVGYVLMQESMPEYMWSLSTVILNVAFSIFGILIAVIGGTWAKDWSWENELLLWHIPFVVILIVGPMVLSESPSFQKAVAQDADASAQTQHRQGPLTELLCNSELCGRVIATVICWSACTVGFYGLSYCSGNISSGLYTNLALLAVVDIISYGLAGTFIQLVGVKQGQIYAFVLAALAMVLCGSLPAGGWRVASALCSRLFLNLAFTTIYLLLMECFPTECRGSASGIANFIARLFGLCTPLFATMSMVSVAMVISIFCVLAAFATWTLPNDTLARPRSDDLPYGSEHNSDRKV